MPQMTEREWDPVTRFSNFLPELDFIHSGKKKLARITVERGCGRLEWSCLDWNQPSIDFYLSLGAVPMSDWTAYRLTGETLQKAAQAQG